LVRSLQSTANVTVLPQSRDGFLTGLNLYAARPDKEYSLTDCISMETMRQEGITDILTHDNHFTQEGFTILL
jgi:predicted nucleic acid-binding protein